MQDMATITETHNIANTFFKKSVDHLVNLYMRWQCEKEYEDFNDYCAAFSSHLDRYCEKAGVELRFIKGTKRPFGFKFRCNDTDYHVTVNSREARIRNCK